MRSGLTHGRGGFFGEATNVGGDEAHAHNVRHSVHVQNYQTSAVSTTQCVARHSLNIGPSDWWTGSSTQS